MIRSHQSSPLGESMDETSDLALVRGGAGGLGGAGGFGAWRARVDAAHPGRPVDGAAVGIVDGGDGVVSASSATFPSSDSPAPSRMGGAHLAALAVKKSYWKGNVAIPVLRGVDFEVRPGEFTAIVGQSGSGKSTLLHLLGTLDAPDAGEIQLRGQRIDNIAARERDVIRNQRLGMIFQFYHLLPELSTLENVLAPIMIREGVFGYWRNRRGNIARATRLLEMVGLGHRLSHRPRELSGGEMQRAAIARALIADPEILLADEPTGNLDRQTGREILTLLRTLNDEHRLTIVMVTHDLAIASQADRTVRLVEGLVEQV
ncbi:MAG: ABC transporter ATP-binding protein [Planctomycetota bacterium]